MKRKSLWMGAVSLCALLVSGCTNLYTGSQAIQPTVKAVPAVYRPIYDVDKTRTVEGQATHNVLFMLFAWGDNNYAERGDYVGNVFDVEANVRRAATYNACARYGCDALVGATYTTKFYSNPFFSQIVCTVKGFPAKLKSVEEIPYKELKTVP